jgi:4-hydroxybenzoate polyprenyltransferase
LRKYRTQIDGFIRLTRYREYLSFVVVSTCLGMIAAYGQFGWQLAVVLLANELAVAFAFMINDVEDAADDALDAAKARRNPVSAGMISYRAAYSASFIVAALSAVLYALLGMGPFVIGTVCLLIAFLYSWRPVRLKSIPFVDLISHALMLAGLQFAAAYFTFSSALGPRFFWPFVMALGVSAYGELFNELRDLEGDIRAGVTHTASVLGPHASRYLATACFTIGCCAAFISLFVVQLVPLWVLALLAISALVLALRPLLHSRQGGSFVAAQAPFHKPVEIAAAFALTVRVVGPWAGSTANTIMQSSFAGLVLAQPWMQPLIQLWQFQPERVLRLF